MESTKVECTILDSIGALDSSFVKHITGIDTGTQGRRNGKGIDIIYGEKTQLAIFLIHLASRTPFHLTPTITFGPTIYWRFNVVVCIFIDYIKFPKQLIHNNTIHYFLEYGLVKSKEGNVSISFSMELYMSA